MHILFLVIGGVLAGIVGFVSMSEYFSYTGGKRSQLITMTISYAIFCGSLTWFVFFAMEPARFENPYETKIVIIDNVAVAVKNTRVFNMNDFSKRQFEDGQRVTIWDYSDGPYVGLFSPTDSVKMEF